MSKCLDNSSSYMPCWAASSGCPGLTVAREGFVFSTDLKCRDYIKLCIFDENGNLVNYVDMTESIVSGNIRAVFLTELRPGHFSYCFNVDGNYVEDPYRRNSTHIRKWKEKKDSVKEHAACYISDFDWEGDRILNLPYSEVVGYSLHVRGYTAHSSSGVKNKGTYLGIVEKIDYLKELGINQIDLMPAYDFYEWDSELDSLPKGHPKFEHLDAIVEKPKEKLNYWGFKRAAYLCPKSNYAVRDSVFEFKTMVKELHKAGIEVIMRFYFPNDFNRNYVSDILRFWASDYHIDGFHLMGDNLPIDLLTSDMALCDRKIYYKYYNEDAIMNTPYESNPNLAVFNSDFAVDIRKFLKSDENMLQTFLYRMRNTGSRIHNINYITDYEGFTLNDLVSYDYKHNEDNGEDNRDGENFNYSWNCGNEGVSRKKSVMCLRERQVKNALIFLLMAQGTPMLLAGDEFLNSQNGNNNAYCQDNEIGWINWKSTKASERILSFTKELIRLRKSHPILHCREPLRIMDYAACGYPDLSYHADAAWYPKFDNHLRHIAIMLCGKYAKLTRTADDDFFYMAYNLHWENHSFALPKLPKGLKWKICMMSCETVVYDKVVPTVVDAGDEIIVPDRTIVILKSEQSLSKEVV